jgi:hypothetical protein
MRATRLLATNYLIVRTGKPEIILFNLIAIFSNRVAIFLDLFVVRDWHAVPELKTARKSGDLFGAHGRLARQQHGTL